MNKISRRGVLIGGGALASYLTVSRGLAQGATVNIVLVAGASNALAYGTDGQPFPGGWTDDPAVMIWNQNAQWIQTYQPGVNSDTVGTYWGPEAEYCRQRRLARPLDNLCVVKVASGGTMRPLANPSEPTFFPYSPVQNQFARLIAQTYYAQEILRFLGHVPVVDVMLVEQGEGEATATVDGIWSTHWRFYASVFFTSVRLAMGAPKMRIVLTRIFPLWDPANRVRNEQVALGGEPQNAWIDIDDVSRLSDDRHFDALGTKEAGRRMWVADSAIIS
jgi:hypothetical protein